MHIEFILKHKPVFKILFLMKYIFKNCVNKFSTYFFMVGIDLKANDRPTRRIYTVTS